MRKLIRVLSLVCFCLSCFSISCAQTPQDEKKELIEKANILKAHLEQLKEVNRVYNEKKKGETDRTKVEELRTNHKKEAQDLLAQSISPAYKSFTEAFNNGSVNRASIQDEINKLDEQFKMLEQKIGKKNSDQGDVSGAVRDNLPTIQESLEKILTFINIPLSPPPPVEASMLQSLRWFILIFISVLISFGLLFKYKLEVNKQFDQLHQDILAIRQQINTNQTTASQEIFHIKQTASENQRAIDNLQTFNRSTYHPDIKALQTRLNALEGNRHASVAMMQPILADLPVVKSPPQEGTVADFIGRFDGNGIKAKPAFMSNDMLEKTDGEAIYLLFQTDRQQSSFFAIPIHPRFTSTQDYSRFSKFYDCDQPSSGEVWIVAPAHATYDEQANQWRLSKRGKLQIK
jgi:predicted  nucleic acid-binding Zn-ribbon protein